MRELIAAMKLGRDVIVAADGGSHTHRGRHDGLHACPQVTVEYRAETFAATATALHGAHRTALGPTIAARHPDVRRVHSQTSGSFAYCSLGTINDPRSDAQTSAPLGVDRSVSIGL